MLKNIQKMLENDFVKLLIKLVRESAVDPEVFNDPRALRTSWKPHKGGGANFTTHVINKENMREWTVRKTFRSKLFGAVFMLPGFFMLYRAYLQPNDLIIFTIVGTVFVVSGYFLMTNRNDIKIDFVSALISTKKLEKRFDEVVAIQIIEERVKSNKSSYKSYELNIVFSDYTRLTVLDHAHLEGIRESSSELARKFNCPVWDGSRENMIKLNQRKVS